MKVAVVLLAIAILFAAFKIHAPYCRTCKKKKMQMHFTDKPDCLRCHFEGERG